MYDFSLGDFILSSYRNIHPFLNFKIAIFRVEKELLRRSVDSHVLKLKLKKLSALISDP